MELRVTSITVCRPGETVDAVGATTVSIVEEGAGEFLLITRFGDGKIAINPSEWPTIREAIDRMVKECRS